LPCLLGVERVLLVALRVFGIKTSQQSFTFKCIEQKNITRDNVLTCVVLELVSLKVKKFQITSTKQDFGTF